MKKFITLLMLALITSVASFAQLLPVTAGTTTLCTGATTTVSEIDSTTTGTWSSSNTAVASVEPWTGWTGTERVTGVSAGTATITYTATPGGSYVTILFTVTGAAPAAITGVTSLCVGGTSALSDATPGGTWSSSTPGVATISSSGVVTAVAGGGTTISYAVSGCPATVGVTVGPTIIDSISGPSGSTSSVSVCAGSSITLTDATPGGTWSSASTGTATVSSTGVVTGVTAGGVYIMYTIASGCGGAASADMYVVVTSVTSAGTISGATSVLQGTATALSETVSGGTWNSSNTAIAAISGGVVSGVAAGTATISYTVSGCGSSFTTTAPMTVTAFSGISGHVNVDPSGGENIRVWLITYNPTTLDLEASDSTDITGSGSIYYQFTGMPTDSFRIKAAVTSSLFAYDSVYAPTYHTSNFFWHDATVLYHTSGVGDINQDINMAYGTTASGPGFIGGSVTTGANRGTTDGAPAVGVLIYALNSSGALVGKTYTDASGNYSFSALPLGTYTIYPEGLNYHTTPYTSITLTASAHSVTAASFIQHTVSKTFTPVNVAVNNVKPAIASVNVFPNPTNGVLDIQWQETATELSTVTIADVTGKELLHTMLNMNKGTGASQLDLSSFANGMYLVSIKSPNIDYNGKIEVQH